MIRSTILAFALVSASFSAAHAGRIFVSNDEWLLSNYASTVVPTPGDVTVLAANIARFTTGANSGKILIRSDNFGLTGSVLFNALTSAGYTVTVDASAPVTAAGLAPYQAVFLANTYPADTSGLVQYVNAGGGVFLEGGTGVGGAAGEAAAWNPFLNAFGLGFASVYNGASGVEQAELAIPIPSANKIFQGVGSFYVNNGNNIIDTNLSDPHGQLFCNIALFGGCSVPVPLFAAYDSAPIPEPAVIALLGLGAAALAASRRRAK